MAAFRQGLGFRDEVEVGDRCGSPPAACAPIDGVVDFVSPHFLGVRSDDALYRFIHGFDGSVSWVITCSRRVSTRGRRSGCGPRGWRASRAAPTTEPRRRGRPLAASRRRRWRASDRRKRTTQRDRDRAEAVRLFSRTLRRTGSNGFRRDELLDAVIDGEPIQMFVMAADIRESTTLMKESVRFERFALIMDKFVTSVRRGLDVPAGGSTSSPATGSSRTGSCRARPPTGTRSASSRPRGTSRTRRTSSSTSSAAVGGLPEQFPEPVRRRRPLDGTRCRARVPRQVDEPRSSGPRSSVRCGW